MTMERYLKLRTRGWSLEEIQTEFSLSRGTAYTFELGYTCQKNGISLDVAIEIIKKLSN